MTGISPGQIFKKATPLYTKWFLPISNANIFQTDVNTNLADLRGIQQAEKELDKNVLEIKKLSLNKKNFFV